VKLTWWLDGSSWLAVVAAVLVHRRAVVGSLGLGKTVRAVVDVRVSYPWLQRTGRARQGDARRSQRTWLRWSRRGGGSALAVARCGLQGPPVTYVYPDHERGVFRGEKEPAKAMASLLLQ